MNTYPKNNDGTGTGLLSHPEQLSNHASAYERITERVISLLEQGTIPWQKSFDVKRGFPRNLISQRPYRGSNVLLLHSMGYESPFWLTFRQAQQLGGNVRKGEHACPVVFGDRRETEDEVTGEKTNYTILRLYSVFNLAQCEGLGSLPDPTPIATLSKASDIVDHMPQRPEIKHGFAKAFYHAREDFIGFPGRENFTSEDEYFSALFHELTHSTGHASRLNRPGITERNPFGSDGYSKEELIAEMGAAFLCGHAGIVERTLNNSAAYIRNWLEALRNDRKLFLQAASQAQRAADFILGSKFEDNPESSNE